MISSGNMHLYIHIPFCRYRCDYCDFFTRIAVPERRQAEILRATALQAEELLKRHGVSRLNTIYVGGGTPSALLPEALSVLLSLLRDLTIRYGPAEETTVELNPEDLTDALLCQLIDAGTNRFSLGIQAMQEDPLHRIGRFTTLAATRAGVDLLARCLARESGNGPGNTVLTWSADLIAGIPDTTVERTLRDLKEILSFEPDHLSVYELGVEPETVLGNALRRGKLLLRSSEEVAEELDAVRDQLLLQGYGHYEISNFARPGRESRHNQAYWRMAAHLGVGPGAVGTLPEPEPRRFTNTRNFTTFRTAPDRGLLIEELSRSDFTKELLMMGLRTSEGVLLSRLFRHARRPLETLIPETLLRWNIAPEQSGAGDGESRLVLPPAKRVLLNSFLRDAFREIDRTLHGTLQS